MADQFEQERVTQQTNPSTNQSVVTREVVSDSREARVNRAARIVWFITGLIVALLATRVILALLGANLANPFASFIYGLSDPFVSAFRGLLQVGEFQAGVVRLELETIVAIIVYMLIGWGIASAIRLAGRQ